MTGSANKSTNRLRQLLPVFSILTVVVVWELLSIIVGTSETGGQRSNEPYKIVPGIEDVFGAFITFAGYWKGGLGAESTKVGADATYWGAFLGLGYNTGVSVLRVIVGYLLGVTAGLFLALAVSWSQIIRDLISFPAHFARMLPLIAMLPIFALWFGNSELGTFMFVGFAVGIVIFVIAINAIGNVPNYYADYAYSLGANRMRTYLTVIFPAAMPQIRSGILLGVAFSWSAVLAAEIIGKQFGLGHILSFSLYYAATKTIALTGLVTIAISAGTYLAASKVLAWVTRWAE